MIGVQSAQSTSSGPGERSRPGSHAGRPVIEGALLATRILIVEDEAMIAWTLESLFEELGFAAIELAPTGQEAIAAAGRARPGLIVSDINLGQGIDGIEAAAAIVATGPIPVMFITGYASDTMRARVERDLPGAAVLRKPVQLDELRAAVADALLPRRSN